MIPRHGAKNRRRSVITFLVTGIVYATAVMGLRASTPREAHDGQAGGGRGTPNAGRRVFFVSAWRAPGFSPRGFSRFGVFSLFEEPAYEKRERPDAPSDVFPRTANVPTHAPSPQRDAEYEQLRATQEAFRRVALAMQPYLVRIETVGGAQPSGFLPTLSEEDTPGQPRRLQTPFRETVGSHFVVADGPTTGIVYASDGYLITSSFNFVREPLLISVTLADGRRLAAELVARDQVRKIALLKVETSHLKVPTWCPSSEVRVGQWAVAVGLALGGPSPAVSAGIISALGRMHRNAVQTDAKLSPANYGGPLCDLRGRVIGLCVPMAQHPGELAGAEMYDSGVGFAVPGERVREIVAALKTGRSFYRGWLGIQIDPRVRDAVVIRNIADPSPMQAAGIQPGDRILAAQGTPIHHFGHLTAALNMIPAGEQVHLIIGRGEQEFETTVTLARNTELGPLPELEEPFDPSEPAPSTPGDE